MILSRHILNTQKWNVCRDDLERDEHHFLFDSRAHTWLSFHNEQQYIWVITNDFFSSAATRPSLTSPSVPSVFCNASTDILLYYWWYPTCTGNSNNNSSIVPQRDKFIEIRVNYPWTPRDHISRDWILYISVYVPIWKQTRLSHYLCRYIYYTYILIALKPNKS